MDLGIKVGDIMSREFTIVSSSTPILECAKLMIKKKKGSLVLKDQDNIKGLITERDILWLLSRRNLKDFASVKAGDLARKKVISIRPSADLLEAIGKMNKSKYHFLPVIDKKDVIGFLTLSDILKIQPAVLDLLQTPKIKDKQKTVKEGICEQCGASNSLCKVDEMLLCKICKEKM